MSKRLSTYAIKSFNSFNQTSVVEHYPKIIKACEKRLEEGKKVYYVGVKNTNVIPYEYLNSLEEKGFLIHTKDAMSERGRAIDHHLTNPITGRMMSGSSSGTAINVFKDINDLGIGTDGGGSVLGPAIALNLYGFISPLICNLELSKYSKKSTDNIVFQPSIGFISKTIEPVSDAVNASLDLSISKPLNVCIAKPIIAMHEAAFAAVQQTFKSATLTQASYNSISREMLMKDLQSFDFENDLFVSFEGPVDLFEYGDSLLGHYSNEMKQRQMLGHKYYLTVVNMLGLSAIIIPTKDLSVGILMVCKSDEAHIKTMLDMAKKVQFTRSELEQRYFSVENY